MTPRKPSKPHPPQCAQQNMDDSRICSREVGAWQSVCLRSAADREAHCIASDGEVGWPPLETHDRRQQMIEIAAVELDLSYSPAKVSVRLFAPEWDKDQAMWSCRFEIGEPVNVDREIYGASSLQALFFGAKTLSVYLYGSDLYKNGELGICGQFGGDLSIPAPQVMLAWAPFPF